MQNGVVIELDERLERDTQALAVVENRAVVIGNPPWTGIDIEALLEFAGLLETTEFSKGIPAPQGPVAAAGPAVELQNLDVVSSLAQLKCCRHAGKPGAEDDDGSALRIAVELDRTFIAGVGRKPQTGHRMIHRSAAGNRSDQGQQIAPANGYTLALHHNLLLNWYPVPSFNPRPNGGTNISHVKRRTNIAGRRAWRQIPCFR